MTELAGPLLFVRYAYPPNALGYCGPADSTAFREYGLAGTVDQGLVELAQAFSGAWPYLELIAAGTGIADPLDRRVVEAYWVGSGLLDALPLRTIADSLESRFRPRVGAQFGHLAEGVLAGGVPHHSFHVFGVYPWVGLLGDDRKADKALTVLDRCRIRWGQVISRHGGQAVVRCRPLRWDGRYLSLGEPELETANCSVGGAGPQLSTGDWVSLHWHWVCDRLTPGQLRALQGYTLRHLDLVNHRVTHRAVEAALG
ncbi:MAG TPA: DUF6390 family protein [Rugosimonospora sp.]|nr:DUF6390 family protein [Rugosimonospora sp.]